MSGYATAVKDKAKSKTKRLFDIRILQGALAEVKSGEPGSMVAKTFTFDEEVNKAFEVGLGMLFRDIDRSCTQIIAELKSLDPNKVITLQSPGKSPPQQQFSVTVTTAAAIWSLMDDNERWTRERETAFK
jgi:hypothetical protein